MKREHIFLIFILFLTFLSIYLLYQILAPFLSSNRMGHPPGYDLLSSFQETSQPLKKR